MRNYLIALATLGLTNLGAEATQLSTKKSIQMKLHSQTDSETKTSVS